LVYYIADNSKTRWRLMMNKKIKTILAAGLLTLGMAAQACTLDAWDDNTSTASAGGPGEPNNFARYSGLCAMQTVSATAGATPAVLNNGQAGATSGPGVEESMIARFYFIANGTGTATLFQTYAEDAGTTPVYTVNYDSTSGNVTVVSEDGGTNAVAPVSASKNWHSVEVSWAQGGAINLWVDVDAEDDPANGTGTSGNAASVISAVVLGDVGATSTFTDIIFDSYESRRTSAIGRLRVGDATGDDTVNIIDAISVVNEINGTPSVGQPDCTEDGAVNIIDAICIVNIINAAP
jgi:hypothetical protein